MVFSSPDSCRSDRPGRTNTSARQMGRLSPGENLGPRCSASQQGCCQGSGRVHPGLTGQLPPHALPEPHGGGIRGSWDSPPPLPPGHRAAVTVRPGPEPRQGGLHPMQGTCAGSLTRELRLPHALGQLSTATREKSVHSKIPHATAKVPCATTKI